MLYSANIQYNINYVDNTGIVDIDGNQPITANLCTVIEGNSQYPADGTLLGVDAVVSWEEVVTVESVGGGDNFCALGSVNGDQTQTFTLQSNENCPYAGLFNTCTLDEDTPIQVDVNVFFNPPSGCIVPGNCNYDENHLYNYLYIKQYNHQLSDP